MEKKQYDGEGARPKLTTGNLNIPESPPPEGNGEEGLEEEGLSIVMCDKTLQLNGCHKASEFHRDCDLPKGSCENTQVTTSCDQSCDQSCDTTTSSLNSAAFLKKIHSISYQDNLTDREQLLWSKWQQSGLKLWKLLHEREVKAKQKSLDPQNNCVAKNGSRDCGDCAGHMLGNIGPNKNTECQCNSHGNLIPGNDKYRTWQGQVTCSSVEQNTVHGERDSKADTCVTVEETDSIQRHLQKCHQCRGHPNMTCVESENDTGSGYGNKSVSGQCFVVNQQNTCTCRCVLQANHVTEQNKPRHDCRLFDCDCTRGHLEFRSRVMQNNICSDRGKVDTEGEIDICTERDLEDGYPGTYTDCKVPNHVGLLPTSNVSEAVVNYDDIVTVKSKINGDDKTCDDEENPQSCRACSIAEDTISKPYEIHLLKTIDVLSSDSAVTDQSSGCDWADGSSDASNSVPVKFPDHESSKPRSQKYLRKRGHARAKSSEKECEGGNSVGHIQHDSDSTDEENNDQVRSKADHDYFITVEEIENGNCMTHMSGSNTQPKNGVIDICQSFDDSSGSSQSGESGCYKGCGQGILKLHYAIPYLSEKLKKSLAKRIENKHKRDHDVDYTELSDNFVNHLGSNESDSFDEGEKRTKTKECIQSEKRPQNYSVINSEPRSVSMKDSRVLGKLVKCSVGHNCDTDCDETDVKSPSSPYPQPSDSIAVLLPHGVNTTQQKESIQDSSTVLTRTSRSKFCDNVFCDMLSDQDVNSSDVWCSSHNNENHKLYSSIADSASHLSDSKTSIANSYHSSACCKSVNVPLSEVDKAHSNLSCRPCNQIPDSQICSETSYLHNRFVFDKEYSAVSHMPDNQMSETGKEYHLVSHLPGNQMSETNKEHYNVSHMPDNQMSETNNEHYLASHMQDHQVSEASKKHSNADFNFITLPNNTKTDKLHKSCDTVTYNGVICHCEPSTSDQSNFQNKGSVNYKIDNGLCCAADVNVPSCSVNHDKYCTDISDITHSCGLTESQHRIANLDHDDVHYLQSEKPNCLCSEKVSLNYEADGNCLWREHCYDCLPGNQSYSCRQWKLNQCFHEDHNHHQGCQISGACCNSSKRRKDWLPKKELHNKMQCNLSSVAKHQDTDRRFVYSDQHLCVTTVTDEAEVPTIDADCAVGNTEFEDNRDCQLVENLLYAELSENSFTSTQNSRNTDESLVQSLLSNVSGEHAGNDAHGDIKAVQSGYGQYDNVEVWTRDDDSSGDWESAEADDEFECDCDHCVLIRSHATSQGHQEDGQGQTQSENEETIDVQREHFDLLDISVAELSPLSDLMNNRRNDLEQMFENVIMQMLAVHPDLMSDQTPPPANQTVIDSLPQITASQENLGQACPICLSPYEEQEKMSCLPCQHLFHQLCIQAWLVKLLPGQVKTGALKKKEATLKCFLQDCEWALQRHKKYINGEDMSEDEKEKSQSQKGDGDLMEKEESGGEDKSQKEVVVEDLSEREVIEEDHSQKDILVNGDHQSGDEHRGVDKSQKEVILEDLSEREVIVEDHSQKDILVNGDHQSGDEHRGVDKSQKEVILEDLSEREVIEEDHSQKDILVNGDHQSGDGRRGVDKSQKEVILEDLSEREVIEEDRSQKDILVNGDHQSGDERRGEDKSHKDKILVKNISWKEIIEREDPSEDGYRGKDLSHENGVSLEDQLPKKVVVEDMLQKDGLTVYDHLHVLLKDQSSLEDVMAGLSKKDGLVGGDPLKDGHKNEDQSHNRVLLEDQLQMEVVEDLSQKKEIVVEHGLKLIDEETIMKNAEEHEASLSQKEGKAGRLEITDDDTVATFEDSDDANTSLSQKEPIAVEGLSQEEGFKGDQCLEMTDDNTVATFEDSDDANTSLSQKEPIAVEGLSQEEGFKGDQCLEMTDDNTTKIILDSDEADTSDSDIFPMLNRPGKKLKFLEYSDEANLSDSEIVPMKKMKLMKHDKENEISYDDRKIARDISNKDIVVSLVRKSDVSKAGKIKKTNRVYDSKHPCPFCEKIVGNFSHHILTNQHKNEEAVLQIAKSDGKKRKKLITRLRLRGAHKHNMTVLKEKKGEIFLCRRSKHDSESDDESDEDDVQLEETIDIGRYGPCPECLGWILQNSVKRHLKNCSAADETAVISLSKNSLIVQSDMLLGKLTGEASQALIKEVYPIMQRDEVSDVAKNDDLIVNLGNQWMMRNRGNQIMRKYYTSSVMRLAAKMKMDCQKLTKTKGNFDDFLIPKHFNVVIKSALNCCHITEADEEELNAPSNAIKLGYDVKRMLSAKLAKAIIAEDEPRKKEAEEFRKLMDIEWSLRVTRLARMLLTERSFNQPHTLPLPEDVKKLSLFLQKELENLKLDDTSFSNFSKAAKLTLVRVTLFNRRRCHEVQAMSLRSYAARKTGIDEVGIELRGELTKFENQLLKRNEMVVIRGKTGKGVPVILPPDVKDPFCFLCDPEIRHAAGIQESNQYVFANAGAGVFRTYDAIRSVMEDPRLQLNMPNLIRTSNMRKYMATMLQAMNTTEHERQWILDHLGHTMKVHQIHYRQTSDILERVDVAKVLLIQDLGVVHKFRGKSLQDIQLDDIVECNSTESSAETRETTIPGLSVSGLEKNSYHDEDFIPDLEEEEEQEDNDEDDGQVKKKRKAAKKHTRQKWTLEEEKELRELFKTDLQKNTLPSPKIIEQGIKKSRDKGGVIHHRKRDLIKKKLGNMIAKQKSTLWSQ